MKPLESRSAGAREASPDQEEEAPPSSPWPRSTPPAAPPQSQAAPPQPDQDRSAADPPQPPEPPLPPSETSGGRPIGRRVLLGMLGLGAIGVVGGSKIQGVLDAVINPIQDADPTGITSLIPGGDGFRIYTVTSGFPKESDAAYRLTVDGLVDHPVTLTVADLQSMVPTRLVKDFQCVTGWRVPKVHWEGVALSVLLDQAGVQSKAKALRFESFDGVYTESLTLAEARRPDVIAAYSMLGKPVTTPHGGPVRLYVAPMYGYKSCKWLSRIEVVDRVEPGYWETEGNYDVEGWVGRSNGRDDPATG